MNTRSFDDKLTNNELRFGDLKANFRIVSFLGISWNDFDESPKTPKFFTVWSSKFHEDFKNRLNLVMNILMDDSLDWLLKNFWSNTRKDVLPLSLLYSPPSLPMPNFLFLLKEHFSMPEESTSAVDNFFYFYLRLAFVLWSLVTRMKKLLTYPTSVVRFSALQYEIFSYVLCQYVIANLDEMHGVLTFNKRILNLRDKFWHSMPSACLLISMLHTIILLVLKMELIGIGKLSVHDSLSKISWLSCSEVLEYLINETTYDALSALLISIHTFQDTVRTDAYRNAIMRHQNFISGKVSGFWSNCGFL